MLKLLTEQEVADWIGVTTHAVRKWRREGKIGFIRINNTVRFTHADIADFVKRNRQAPRCASCQAPVDLDPKVINGDFDFRSAEAS